jgi:hypothetical protein
MSNSSNQLTETSQGDREKIAAHIASCLGEIDLVLHPVKSNSVHIDINIVRPSERHPFISLVTTGMSDRPMSTSDGVGAPRYLELLMMLPPRWRLDRDSLQDERWYWPVRLIQFFANFPHNHNTWLGFGHTISNGNPTRAYAQDTKLCGSIVLPALKVPAEFHQLQVGSLKDISFLSIIPLYEDEMKLARDSGVMSLLERIANENVDPVINPTRESAILR